MSVGNKDHNREILEPNLEQARQTAHMAHSVVIKFKELGLPEHLDQELAKLSTDIGDLWAAQKVLVSHFETLLTSSDNWKSVGESLVDIRAEVDHISWHMKSVRRPLTRITRFAYRNASE